MADRQPQARKDTLDKDLEKLVRLEEATSAMGRRLAAPGLALTFLLLAAALAALAVAGEPGMAAIVAAAIMGAFMAMAIGANDVANNVGAAVGARALSLGVALFLAAVCEAAGALIAGSDVVETIAGGIVDRNAGIPPGILVRLMLAALLAAGLWINLATWMRAPVSTTHSIVGAVLGAGLVAVGSEAVQWPVVAAIAGGWILSPILSGVIAAVFLYVVKTAIIYRDDKIAAARSWVPVLIAAMSGAFTAYLAVKMLGGLPQAGAGMVAFFALAIAGTAWLASAVMISRRAEGLPNRNQSLRRLFELPLIASAALLSFAHGANDVANAIGPVAAIVQVTRLGAFSNEAQVPIWVMAIGAFGIAVGLVLFGPRLIRIVGRQITRLNPMRAYCVALSTAVTVILASWFGLPVSSTHTAVGAIFGVGFFREWYTARSWRRHAYLERRRANRGGKEGPGRPPERKRASNASGTEIHRRRLVRRAHVLTIVAAWTITVPVAALLAAILYALFGLIG